MPKTGIRSTMCSPSSSHVCRSCLRLYRRLGHETIQTTVDIYGHVLPASDAEAGAILERSLDAGR